jgi:nitrogen fixation NifU-like protein
VFSETLLDHFQNPRNVGEIEDPEAEAEEENPVCGDRLRLWIRTADGTIADIGWRAEGCAPAIAAASALSQMVRGMEVEQARHLGRDDLAAALGGLPARKMHAALLAVSALHRALARLDAP